MTQKAKICARIAKSVIFEKSKLLNNFNSAGDESRTRTLFRARDFESPIKFNNYISLTREKRHKPAQVLDGAKSILSQLVPEFGRRA